MIKKIEQIWVFNGPNSRFPSGVFLDKEIAEKWINKYNLSGILTAYPADIGVYDWAIQNHFLVITNEREHSSEFIQKFTSASQDHYHYEDGILQ